MLDDLDTMHLTEQSSNTARIDELEQRVMFQDDLLEQLNQSLVTQTQQILALQQHLKLLYQKLAPQLTQTPLVEAFEPLYDIPPHF